MSLRRSAGSEVGLDAAVPALELLEHADHRFGRRGCDAPQSLPLRLGLGLGDPLLVPRPKALLAQGVVSGDVLDRDARHPQQKGGREAGAVLAAHAVDDDSSLRGVHDRGDRGRDVGTKALEEQEVDLARGGGEVRCARSGLFDLTEDLIVVVKERDMDDGHRQLCGRIGLALLVHTEVDDRSDAVVEQGPPALVGKAADGVGANDLAEPGLAAVLGRMPTEVADVEEPVPDEVASFRRQRQRVGSRAASSTSRLRSRLRRARPRPRCPRS